MNLKDNKPTNSTSSIQEYIKQREEAIVLLKEIEDFIKNMNKEDIKQNRKNLQMNLNF